MTVINLLFALFQVSVQRLGARVSVREDIAGLFRGAGVFVVARQVFDQVAAASRGWRASVGSRRVASPVVSSRSSLRSRTTGSRLARPARARHRPAARLPLLTQHHHTTILHILASLLPSTKLSYSGLSDRVVCLAR